MEYRIRNKKAGTEKRLKMIAASVFMGTAVLCTNAAPAVILGTAAAVLCSETAWAMEAGTYLVTVTPSYTDPETGKVEDPGNNEAIGQGMTQKLCGPQGLLEVDSSGNMYLTVRYYLSQFVSDVSFEERGGGSYTACSYERMQTKEPVNGAGNLDDKYGYTDYRIPIRSLDSVFRGKAYIEPMGRNVVYFFQASAPVAGSGDFVTSIRTETPVEAEPEAGAAKEAGAADEGLETDWDRGEGSRGLEEERESEVSRKEADEETVSRARISENGRINGSGDADAPVTGIPEKPSFDRTGRNERGTGSGIEEEYHLQTRYDLSVVPVKEARKLTGPMLEAATGITLTVGEQPGGMGKDVDVVKDSQRNMNRNVMDILLGVSGVLLLRFAAASLSSHKGSTRKRGAERMEEEMSPAQNGTERQESGR